MDISQTDANVVAGQALVVLIMITGHTLANRQGTLKNKICYSQALEGPWHHEGHTAKSWREREKGSEDLGLCPC